MTKSCYQCDKEVNWLAPDSRCGDCTRWTPEQVRGEEPAPEEAENLLYGMIEKYGFIIVIESIDLYVYTSQFKNNNLALNIQDKDNHSYYELHINNEVKLSKSISTDQELINFVNASIHLLNNI